MITMRESILIIGGPYINQFQKDKNLNDRQQTMINRIVRNAILCSLTILCWTFERIAWLLFIFEYTSKEYYDGLLIAKCLTAIALMVDACCMLFTFKFATGLYHRFCNCFDRCCQNFCKCIAEWYQKSFVDDGDISNDKDKYQSLIQHDSMLSIKR